MVKKIIALVLVAVIAAACAVSVYGTGYTEAQLRTADALNHLGLFLGTDIGYQLDRKLTRLEGIVLTIRLFGSEKEALSKSYEHPFKDIPYWKNDEANKYIGYAYNAGISNGRSEADGVFDTESHMTDNMFITFVLRALGYKDSGSGAQFYWETPYELAAQIKLTDSKEQDKDFTRGDAVTIFWNALKIDDYALARSLAKIGIFTEKELEESIEIYTFGEIVSDNTDETAAPEETAPSDETTAPEETAPSDETTAPEDTTTSGGTTGSSGTRPSGGTTAPEETKPNEETTGPAETKPDDETTAPSGTVKPPKVLTYEEYINMSGEEQQAYYESFANPMDYFAWYNAAKAEYDKNNAGNDIGSGNIDLGDYFG